MGSAEKPGKAPIRMRIGGGSFSEILCMLAALREYVLLEVVEGEARGSYLFVGGAYFGNEVDRLRPALRKTESIEVLLTSADSLAGLYGRSAATAMQLVLDAACDVSGG
ncbi:MAG: hypothetical protein ABI193_08590 [Minicystis sp.]